uniref:CD24 n=1 Tax=Balaenoptera musculus TaxID=9771 RepID=A0A8C0DFT0_BALMU
ENPSRGSPGVRAVVRAGTAGCPPRGRLRLFFWGIYSNQTTVVTPSSNSSQHTSAAPNPANATTKASDGALQSTASLLVISVSLLHLYC